MTLFLGFKLGVVYFASWAVFPLRCATAQLHSVTRPFAQWNLILAHLHSKLYVVQKSHSPFTVGHASVVVIAHGYAWLRNCVRTKTNICSVQNFLRGNTAHEAKYVLGLFCLKMNMFGW